jgi:hypothetical protein
MKWIKLSLIPLLVFLAVCSSSVPTTSAHSAPTVGIVAPLSAGLSPMATMIVTDPVSVEKKDVLGPLQTKIIKVMAVPTETKTAPAPSPTVEKPYEVLAPNKIKAGDFTIVIKVDLSTTRLIFNSNTEYPTSIATSYPEDNMPAPIKNVDFKFKEMQLDLKMVGGGGGGGWEEKTAWRGYGIQYKISPTLTKGKKVHVTANVSFNDYVGIKEPVPFEFDLVVK